MLVLDCFLSAAAHLFSLCPGAQCTSGRTNTDHALPWRQESGAELTTHFELSDNMYVQARVPAVETVSLWLGANVMLEYPLDEADALLSKNHAATQASVADLAADMAFCREQITTTEVNIARIYNWNVRKNREQKA